MSNAEDHAGTRRDFLYYATAGTGAVAVGAAVWPLVNQMNPSADVLALSSIRVDMGGLIGRDANRDPLRAFNG